jgi:hypothetical protein
VTITGSEKTQISKIEVEDGLAQLRRAFYEHSKSYDAKTKFKGEMNYAYRVFDPNPWKNGCFGFVVTHNPS